jgi:hypothetical protein
MSEIVGCKIDEVRVTRIAILNDPGRVSVEVAFFAEGRPAGVLTVDGIEVDLDVANLVTDLVGAIEKSVASRYGEAGAPSLQPLPQGLGEI